jgi:hypothetical protein
MLQPHHTFKSLNGLIYELGKSEIRSKQLFVGFRSFIQRYLSSRVEITLSPAALAELRSKDGPQSHPLCTNNTIM